jgi:hypothetical protein
MRDLNADLNTIISMSYIEQSEQLRLCSSKMASQRFTLRAAFAIILVGVGRLLVVQTNGSEDVNWSHLWYCCYTVNL